MGNAFCVCFNLLEMLDKGGRIRQQVFPAVVSLQVHFDS